jgi:curved DNA-binding protein CbpA
VRTLAQKNHTNKGTTMNTEAADKARALQRAQQLESVQQERAATDAGKQYSPDEQARRTAFAAYTQKPGSHTTPASGAQGKPWYQRPWPLSVAAASVLFLTGHVHVITGSSIERTVLGKVSWSLSETVVNSDALMKMPLIAARTQYPLTLLALERAQLIESDAQRQNRVTQERQAEVERFQQEARAVTERIQQEVADKLKQKY